LGRSPIGLTYQDDGIDDVNDAIIGFDVGSNDGCVFDFKSIGTINFDGGAFNRGNYTHFCKIGLRVFAGDDVEGQDSGKL
jgi:hypothetical protein